MLFLCVIRQLFRLPVHCDILWYMPRSAKLFRNGRSQAVRLPAEYRFAESEVYIRRDPDSGDVILSRRPESWSDYFELMGTIEVPDEFMSGRHDARPQKRQIF